MYDPSLVFQETQSLRTHHQSAQCKEDEHHAADLKEKVLVQLLYTILATTFVRWSPGYSISVKKNSKCRSLTIRPASEMDTCVLKTPFIYLSLIYTPSWLTWPGCIKEGTLCDKKNKRGSAFTSVTVRTDILVAIILPPTTANPVQSAWPRTPENIYKCRKKTRKIIAFYELLFSH